MKKTKIDRRIENAFSAFFDNENNNGMNLVYANESALAPNILGENFTRKADKWIGIFKKAFLFLPGVLILHLACFATALFYKDFGINIWMLFWFASGIFMVWAGLGDLKNKKHLLLPLSVILSIAPFALLFSYLSVKPEEYSFYLFPIFFVIPILAKGRLDKVDRNVD